MANLILISHDEKKHYAAIKNLSQLLASSNGGNGQQQHFCLTCLQGFPNEESRNKHFEYCKDHEAVRIDMPEENSFVRFHSGQYQFEDPLLIYADFETILHSSKEETELYSEASYMKRINCHVPSGFCTYSTCAYREVKDLLKLYWGRDCMKVFCDHLKEEAKRLYHMFPEMPMKRLTQEEWRKYKGVTKCHICFNDLEEDDKFHYKVRDHCYYTGLYPGPAHRICNLRYAILCYIPIVFHNLSC